MSGKGAYLIVVALFAAILSYFSCFRTGRAEEHSIRVGTCFVDSQGEIYAGDTRTGVCSVPGLPAETPVFLTVPSDVKDSIVIDAYVYPAGELNVRVLNVSPFEDIDPGSMEVTYVAIQ